MKTIESKRPYTAAPVQKKDAGLNNRPFAQAHIAPPTGLPSTLQANVERLSGFSLSDVQVHYNSPNPADLGALAYTQGTEIHVAPGQEKHLPHEAWHVVQQKQKRAPATRQLKGKGINDSQALEQEADVMGKQAKTPSTHEHGKGCGCSACQSTPAQKPAFSVGKAAGTAASSAIQMMCDKGHAYHKNGPCPGTTLEASPKHIKGNAGGEKGKTTKASRAVMDHAKAQIEGGRAAFVGDSHQGNDLQFQVPRQHKHKAASAKTRNFHVHKGGGGGKTVGYYMQEGEPSESESSEEEEENKKDE